MVELDNCPHCKATLIDEPIPEEYREKYYGGATHFRREIGIYSRERDMTMYYICPDCKEKI
jgi:Zn-finger nucleic acid-binding protein